MADSKVIIAEDVNKYFGSYQALNDLSVTIEQGDIFGFIGRNGAGKTTFMRILCGLMKQSSGTIRVVSGTRGKTGGSNIAGKIIDTRIGFLPQNVKLKDSVMGKEMINFFAKLKNSNPSENISYAGELEVDLKKTVRNLSPGQQRKLQLVIATIGLPELLILDEPTAGLDPVGVQQVREIIRILNKKGCTIFISSHVLMELDNLCSRVAMIEKGRILYEGPCGNTYEFETDGISDSVINLLPRLHKDKCIIKDTNLIADIDRTEVPEFLQMLHTNGIKVYGVRRQGLEALYNHLVKEGA